MVLLKIPEPYFYESKKIDVTKSDTTFLICNSYTDLTIVNYLKFGNLLHSCQ
jgi:hypothetical protein